MDVDDGIPSDRMELASNPLLRRAIILGAFTAAILICQYFLVREPQWGTPAYWYVTFCFPAFPLLVAVRIFWTAHGLTGRERAAWMVIAWGSVCMAVAEAFWAYLEVFSVAETPMTELATAGYAFSPICLLVGMLLYQERSGVVGVPLVQAGNLGIVFSSTLFAYLLVVYQLLSGIPEGSEIAILKTLQGSVIMAATVTGIALATLHFKGEKRAIVGLLLLGMLCVVVEYFAYIYFLVNGLDGWANPFSILYLIASTLWYLAASEQQHIAPVKLRAEEFVEQEKRARQIETLLSPLAVAVVLGIWFAYGVRAGPEILPILAGSLSILVGSLALRNWWAQRVESRLNQQLRDQTEYLSKARDVAEASDIAKSRFLSWVSHETRTPLSGVLGFAELLESRHFGELNKDQADFVQSIQKSGNHLLELINDLLDVTKITMGEVELVLEDVPLGEVVTEVGSNIESGSGGKSLTFINEVDSDGPILRVDRRRLRQCLYNLLSNAFKFTRDGGVIGVRWRNEREGWLCIEVWDRGIGIAEADLERVFEDFYQVDRKRDEALGGSGIGLALTRRLAVLHGGEVRVESAVGQGSSFSLILPLADEQSEPVARQLPEEDRIEKNEQHERDRSTCVLVVDDNPSNVGVIQGLLRVRGIEPIVALSGDAAVELAEQKRPTLVLMDIHMPGCDGFEALARIRSNEALVDIPIVAMTASASDTDRQRYVQAGFNGFLAKPIDSGKLDRQIARFTSVLDSTADTRTN
jgi:signal transduction histidine kinase/CheY-like chemotaxis protein